MTRYGFFALILATWASPALAAEELATEPAPATGQVSESPFAGNPDLFYGSYKISDEARSETTEARIGYLYAMAQGMLQSRRGKLAAAVQSYEQGLELSGGTSAEALTALAEICYVDDTDRAEKYLERAVERAPDYYRAHWVRAMVREKRGKIGPVLESLNRCLELKKTFTEARRKRASLLQRKTDDPEGLRQAIEDYRILQQALPQQSPLWNYFIGLCYYHLKEYGRAEKVLEPLIEGHGSGEAAFLLASCKEELGDLDGALKYLRRLGQNQRTLESMANIELRKAQAGSGKERREGLTRYFEIMGRLLAGSPRSKTPKNYFDAGRVALELGRENEAVNYLRTYSRLAEDDAAVRPFLLRALILTNDPGEEEEIRELFTEYVETHPATATLRVRFDYASYLINVNNYSDATRELVEVARVAPDDPRPAVLLAHVSFRNESYQECLDYARRAMERAPHKKDEILMLMGHARLRMASDEAAAEIFEEAVLSASDSYRAIRRFEIGEIYRGESMDREGLRQWEKALVISPENHNLRYEVGRAYLQEGSLEVSAKHLRQVAEGAESMETRSQAYTLWAYVDAVRGETEESEAHYLKAVESFPKNYYAHTGLAHLMADQKRYEAARIHFREAIAHHPEDATLLIQLGITCDKLDDVECAEDAARRAIELAPDHSECYNFLGYMYAERAIKLDKAIELIEKAMELQPDDPNITDSLGWAYFQMGRTDEAIATLEKAISLVDDESRLGSSVILEHLGDAYHKAGKIERALEYWEKAAKGAPESVTAKEKLSKHSTETVQP